MKPKSKEKVKRDQERLRASFGFIPEGQTMHLISPEGVPIQVNRVSPFVRLGALVIDGAIQIGVILLVTWALFIWLVTWSNAGGELFSILWFLFWAFMRMPYFIFMEFYLRGQTLGKRLLVSALWMRREVDYASQA